MSDFIANFLFILGLIVILIFSYFLWKTIIAPMLKSKGGKGEK